ncbi:MAG: hypothetical protein A3D74_01335 [Candidatus Levybacteria bacterium RIFCSPHIGHO2_02_FULL_37_13]|nr:MAG: hypothetical protein A3D74_01335 [Candidatus Levybacteria bacterium RIFCSPHIGHO2_02_FULL_37_13]
MPFLFDAAQFNLILKIAILVFLILYIIFSIIVLTQVRLMNNILKQSFASTVLAAIALGNLILALSLFLTALVIL